MSAVIDPAPGLGGEQARPGGVPASRSRQRRLQMPWLRTALAPLVFAAVVLLLWQAGVRLASVSPSLLPPPTDVWAQLASHGRFILGHAVPTATESLLAFAISVPVGMGLAMAMVYSRTVRESVYPNLVLFQIIPKIALAPLFIVWFGIGAPSRVTFAVVVCFFPVVVATIAGLDDLGRDTLRLCRSLRLGPWKTLIHVRLPAALPHVFSGLRISVTLAVIGVVVGEFIAAQSGLGYLILFASSRQQMDLALACMAVLGAVGLLLYGAVVLAERLVLLRYGR